MRQVRGAVEDADVILYVTDTVESSFISTHQPISRQRDADAALTADEKARIVQSGTDSPTRQGSAAGALRSREIVEKIRQSSVPTIVVINKIDLSTPEKVMAMVEGWRELLPDAQVVTASALHGFNTDGMLGRIVELLPEGEAYFDRDALTDRSLRFFASEIIREKILLTYDKEVPYSVEVAIEEYREEPTIDRIRAVIYVSRASQKGIVIGHKGEKLKRVGTAARKDLEDFLGKKVFLELFVKVADDWRNSEGALRKFGYDE